MKLFSACYGVSLVGMLAAPALAQHKGMKAMWDFRSDDDRDSPVGCGE